MQFHDEFGRRVEKPSDVEVKWRPSARALVIQNSNLLCVRPNSHGRWEIPGGAIDIGETPEQAVRREVLEETGYSIKLQKSYPIHLTSKFFFCDDTFWQSLIFVFLCSVESQKPIGRLDPEQEIAEVRWIPFGELAALGIDDGTFTMIRQTLASQ